MANATVTAGRGVIFIAIAKAYFMIAGYVIFFALPRLLSKIQWGNYLLVVRMVSVIDNVIVTGTIQGVSKFTAQDDVQADAVKRTALKIQLLLGGGIAAVYVAAAPLIASFKRDMSLTHLYQLSAGIVVCYSFYAVFVGSLNGLRRFGGQASLDMGFATIRAVLILTFAAAGWGVAGAVGGFVTAACVILVISIFWVGLPRSDQSFDARAMLKFMVPLFLYTFTLNLIMLADLVLLKRYVGDFASGLGHQAQADLASTWAGIYGAGQTLAFIPYQAILAVAFVIFPLISRSTFESDLTSTQAYIKQTLRFSLIFVVGVAVVFMANPEAVIHVPYPEDFRAGGPALRILAAGMVCFSMFTIINTILNGAGLTSKALFSGLVTLALTAVANTILIPRAGSPQAALQVAGGATACSMAVGMLISTILMYRQFAAAFPIASVCRLLIASFLAYLVGQLVPEVSRWVTLAECVLVFGVYWAVLVLIREFSTEDLAKIKQVFSRRSGA